MNNANQRNEYVEDLRDVLTGEKAPSLNINISLDNAVLIALVMFFAILLAFVLRDFIFVNIINRN